MSFALTPKQKQFIFYRGKRLNFLSGSVRSGKTYVSVLKWVLWVAEQPADHEFIMCGKTVSSLRRNCFGYIEQLIGSGNFSYSTTSKLAYIFGHKVYLEGANDERAEQKIRGMTLAGAYCDEITLYPQSFVSMLLSRLSVAGAKLWATCNPDNPMHFIKTDYIDRQDELDCICWDFILTDNTFLPPEYIEAVSKEYSGVFYDRFILGKWVRAEGLVYPYYNNTISAEDAAQLTGEYIVSMDYGTMNPTAMILWCIDHRTHRAVAIKEYYYDGRKTQQQKTDSEYYEELERLTKGYPVNDVICDPAAASFIAEIRKHNKFNVRKAKNNVIEGIRTTGTYLKDKKLLISAACVNTLREFGLYSWDEKASLNGIDAVIKENDHAMDAVRYLCYTYLKPIDW